MTAYVPEELPEVPSHPQNTYDFYGVDNLAEEIEQELREHGIELDLN